MFTGIVEEMGVVKTVVKSVRGCGVTILAKTVLDGLAVGDSVAIDGVCLTVVDLDRDQFSVELSPETLKLTTLRQLTAGGPLNLERALRFNGRLSGHLVAGHVDGVGTIRQRVQEANALHLTIGAPSEVLRYCIVKGSITVDGVSLTINELPPQGLRVTVIPHTAKMTTLGIKQRGEPVNLESDLIGKYVERLLQERSGEPRPALAIDRDYLERRGLL